MSSRTPDSPSSDCDGSRLTRIRTNADIKDPRSAQRQVARYQKAIRKFLRALVAGAGADDVESETLECLWQGVYQERWDPAKGRFRDYLKQSIRYAARKHFKRHQSSRTLQHVIEAVAQDSAPVWAELDNELRAKILEHAIKKLRATARARPRLVGPRLVTLLAEACRQGDVSPYEFLSQHLGIDRQDQKQRDRLRQQLKRGRDLFSSLLWNAARELLPDSSDAQVREELRALRLLSYVERRRGPTDQPSESDGTKLS